MSVFLQDARRLASAMIAGDFRRESILERALPLVPAQNHWLKRMVDQIVKRFGTQRPRKHVLVEFLLENAEFREAASGTYLAEGAVFTVQAYGEADEFIPSSGAFADSRVVSLRTAADVASWLGISEGHLDWYIDRRWLERITPEGPLRHYRYHWKLKRHGRCRLIEAPKFRLREIQRRILREILDEIPIHNAAHGFRRHRSANTHAALHVGNEVVLKMDLENFFPSLSVSRLIRLLMHTGYPEKVAMILTGLCSNYTPRDVVSSFPNIGDLQLRRSLQTLYCRPHFPQGAPTSPAIANICAYRLDLRLSGLAKAANATYTRYADDLLFSGDEAFCRGINSFKTYAAVIAMEEGLAVNHRKTRVMRRSVRQEAVGLVLNEKLNAPRDEFDRLKAVLHHCVLRGPRSVNAGEHANFRLHLIGRIQYVAQSNESRRQKLMRLFDQINWPDQTYDGHS